MRSWHTVERDLRHDARHALTALAGAVTPPVMLRTLLQRSAVAGHRIRLWSVLDSRAPRPSRF